MLYGLIATAIAVNMLPGGVVLIGRPQGIAWLKAYGNKRLEPVVEAMTDDTVFDLASLTKPVATATSVMILVEQGKLDLSTRLLRILPEFDNHGKLLWRFGGLNHPSLALPLPNGDVLVNDDYNHRVIVIDPVTNKIVWQYGHTGVPGTAPGYLNDPDGVDLVPPDSMLITHAPTMGPP